MTSEVIKISNLYKEYHLGSVGRGTLYRDLQSFWAKIRNKPDPNSLIETYDQNLKRKNIMALNGVNFTVKKGEVLGIIGDNGAGKSTLLKVLSRITGPSKGQIEITGKVASLLEVSTGFHPELTGCENVFLNGTIFGMRRKEIEKKMRDILDFAGVEKFKDTPVKRYSSGMSIRLGFAIAAFLDPDILILDEVLAVGDTSFTKKALKKVDEISKEENRTILFVSHNLSSIKTLCSRAILIEQGKVLFDGAPSDTIEKYIKNSTEKTNNKIIKKIKDRNDRKGDQKLRIIDIKFFDKKNEEITECISGEFLEIRFFYESSNDLNNQNFNFGVTLINSGFNKVAMFENDEMGTVFQKFKKKGYISLKINKLNLRSGRYFIDFSAREGVRGHGWRHIDEMRSAKELIVNTGDFWKTGINNYPGDYALFESSMKKIDVE